MIKKLVKICPPLLLLFSATAVQAENKTPIQHLEQMVKASQNQNYEIIYIQASGGELDSYRYRHLNWQQKTYAQLTTLDGSKQEIVQRDHLVSYFQSNAQPFTLNANQILDNLPNLMFVDIKKLAQHYDFIDRGRGRIADRITQVINIKPKDDFRYQFIAFIDEQTGLLLRSDMLDREGNLLEQFRVVDLYQGDNLQSLSDYLNNINFPPLLIDKKEQNEISKQWNITWLPAGFQLIKETLYMSENNENPIISRLYSDGLFSFSLYIADKILPDEQDNLWKQGATTIYSANIGEKEITLVGQIPTSTAKRIVEDIKFAP